MRSLSRWNKTTLLYSIVFVIMLVWAFSPLLEDLGTYQVPPLDPEMRIQYTKALKHVAGDDKLVILAVVDPEFMEMVYHFYYFSIARFHIKNYLFVSLNEQACKKFLYSYPDEELHCFHYQDNTREFGEKLYLRRFLMIHALRLGFDIMMADLDVMFNHNPLKEIVNTCNRRHCDVAALWDAKQNEFSEGVVYVKANDRAIKFFHRVEHYELTHDLTKLQLHQALVMLHNNHLRVAGLNHTFEISPWVDDKLVHSKGPHGHQAGFQWGQQHVQSV